MAALAALPTASSLALPSSTPVARSSSRSCKPCISSVRKMHSFAGLRPQTHVASLGCPQSTERQFARVVARCFAASGHSRGGAASSSCNIGSEIFRVVPIMSGLVLVGVALGFVLLRVEAAVEEAE